VSAAAPRRRPDRRRARRALSLCALLLCWLCAVARAAPPPAVADVAAVPAQGALALTPHLAILADPGAGLTLPQALAAPGWLAATPANLNRGYTDDAIWLRGSLANGGAQALTRWLALGSVRLEDIRFWRLAPGQRDAAPTLLSGTSRLTSALPVRADANYIFPLTLAPGERVDYVLRIHSRSVVSIVAKLWEPAAFRQDEGRDAQSQALLLGPMILAGLYALTMGLRSGDRDFLVLAACIGVSVLYNLQFYGVPFRYFPEYYEWVGRANQPLVALNTAAFALTTMTMLRLDRIAFWRWAYRMPQALFDLVAIASLIDALRRRAPGSVPVALTCLVVWLVLLSRILTVYGLLPDLRLSTDSLNWTTNCAVFLALSIVMARHARALQASRLDAHRARLDAAALEQAVRARTSELQAALIAADEANSAKTDFLARVSHDLRTPLTSIMGFADLMQAGGRGDSERGRIIRRSASHMLAMINDLIDYARGGDPHALNPAPTYGHALFDAIAQEGAALAGKRANRFDYRVLRPLPPVLVLDAKRVRQVLGNLLDNAAKFTSDGLITLTLDWRGDDHGGDAAAVELVITVRDSGCGIAPRDQQRIFEPFLRLEASRATPGLGLGLAIVSNWVQRMGGLLRLDSTPGLGSTMTLTLNTRRAGEQEVPQHAERDGAGMLPALKGAGLRIWIAEDAADIRALLTEELSGQGFEVESAADGQEIIERMMRPQAQAPALLLTDYLMPRADGGAVLEAARRHLPGVPVVLLSATPQFGSGEDGAPAFDACLFKPINLAELRITLARLLGLDYRGRDGHDEEREDDRADAPQDLPPPPVLVPMRELVALGAVSDLADWARELEATQPEYAAFARQAQRLAHRGDLAALRDLSEKAAAE
jgi:signal transduction histidine kinase/CheY-like chemotaxis protein